MSTVSKQKKQEVYFIVIIFTIVIGLISYLIFTEVTIVPNNTWGTGGLAGN
jgi:hypothetical protein